MRAFLFCLFYTFWLVVCFFIALPGFLLPTKKRKLEPAEVKKSLTICRCLFEKNKLDEKVYAFETDQVAASYNQLVFKGYGLIVSPLIYVLKRFSFMDTITLFFVRRWVAVHEHYLYKDASVPPVYHVWLTKFCVLMAKSVGKTISLIS